MRKKMPTITESAAELHRRVLTLTTLGAREPVRNLDGWVFPDGTVGEGVPGATTMWGHVWRTG